MSFISTPKHCGDDQIQVIDSISCGDMQVRGCGSMKDQINHWRSPGFAKPFVTPGSVVRLAWAA